jgi:hypothetical protein
MLLAGGIEVDERFVRAIRLLPLPALEDARDAPYTSTVGLIADRGVC